MSAILAAIAARPVEWGVAFMLAMMAIGDNAPSIANAVIRVIEALREGKRRIGF